MLTQKAAKDNLELILNKPIYTLDDDFWEQMRGPYINELQDLAYNCKQILTQGFNLDNQQIGDFVKTLEQEIHKFTTEYIYRQFRDINTNLLRKFNLRFKKDENGKSREWRDI
jgi:hypothetical protein